MTNFQPLEVETQLQVGEFFFKFSALTVRGLILYSHHKKYIVFRRAVAILFDVAMLFTTTMFLLIAAQNMQSLLHGIIYDLSYRGWIVLITIVLVPFLFLSTPKDFW